MFLVILFWFGLCSFFYWLFWNTANAPGLNLNLSKSTNLMSLIKLSLDRKQSFDCKNVHVPCFVNHDCSDICLYPGGYACLNGICQKAYTKETEIPKCNPKHGIVALLRANEIFGQLSWQCVSLYKQIWSDSDTLMEHVCEGGTIDIDLTKVLFSPLACKCPENTSLIFREMDAFNQPIPRCVKHDHLFSDYKKPSRWVLKEPSETESGLK